MKYKTLFSLIILLTVGAVALALSFHIQFWPFELLLSFAPLFTVITAIGLTLSLLFSLPLKGLQTNWRIIALVSVGLLASVYSIYFSLTVQPPVQLSSTDQPTITFATFNKLYSNSDLSRASDYFSDQNVDVLAIQEAQTDEVEQIREQLGFEYSHAPDDLRTSFGTIVGIISRYPIESAETIALTNDYSLVRAVIVTPEQGKIAFYAVHLPGPFSPDLYRDRDTDIEALGRILQEETLPVVLGGDFNTTVFSPSLRQFNAVTDSIVQPVTLERWPQCSWYGYGAPLCLRIDHVYISEDLQLVDVNISPDLGSDHRAVVVEFAL